MKFNDATQPLSRGVYAAPDDRYWFLTSVRENGHVRLQEVSYDMRGIGKPYFALLSEVKRALREGGDVKEWNPVAQGITLQQLEAVVEAGVKLNQLCERAGLPTGTIYAKIKRQSELSQRQGVALRRALLDTIEELHTICKG